MTRIKKKILGSKENVSYICRTMKIVFDTDGFVPEAGTDRQREQRNQTLKRYINSFPLIINRGVFKKTQKEKRVVNKLKRQYKNIIKDN